MVQSQVTAAGAHVEKTDAHLPFVCIEHGRGGSDRFDKETDDVDASFPGGAAKRRAGVFGGGRAQRFDFEFVAMQPQRVLHWLAVDGIGLHETVQGHRLCRWRRLLGGGKSPLHIPFIDGL